MTRCLPLALLLLASCGPTVITAATVKQEEQAVAWATKELAAAKASMQPLQKYTDSIEKRSLSDGYYLMISPADIKEWGAKAFLPYSFPAKSIHSKITGTLITKEIRSVQILSGNRFLLQLFVTGKEIEVHYKGDLYKPHLKKIKAGIEAGMLLDVVVTLKLKKGKLIAYARCQAVKLKKNNDGLYTSNILTAVNKAITKESWTVQLPTKDTLAPSQLLTTENHIILIYR